MTGCGTKKMKAGGMAGMAGMPVKKMVWAAWLWALVEATKLVVVLKVMASARRATLRAVWYKE